MIVSFLYSREEGTGVEVGTGGPGEDKAESGILMVVGLGTRRNRKIFRNIA